MTDFKANSVHNIKGTMVYAKLGKPDTKYQSTDTEWSVELIIDEDQADDWDATFTKQSSKKIKASEFEAKYKIPCPIEGVKNVYSIKLKRDATKDGEPVNPDFRPKMFVGTGEKDENGKAIYEQLDINRKIANGSKGAVSFYVSSNDYGTFARLQNVRMPLNGFIEYESNYQEPGDEFGDDEEDDVPAPKEAAAAKPAAKPPVKTAASKPAAKPTPKQEPEDDADDSSPF